MKEVRYFEAMYHGGIEQHYTKDTEEFENWMKLLKHFDTASEITYIAYDDGTTMGQAVEYQKL